MEVEFAFGDGESDGGGGEALAEGVEGVRGLRGVGVPPGFGDDVAMAEEHEAVEGVDVFVGGLDEGEDGGGGDALGFGGGARELGGGGEGGGASEEGDEGGGRFHKHSSGGLESTDWRFF